MPRYDFDLITIGAGSGGVASSRRAGSYGARVAIIEESRIGGTCVLRGCVPKKLLVYGAQFADAFADAAGFGWSVAPPRFDWPSLITAKNKELDRLEQIYVNMLKNSGVEIIEGRGILVDPHTVEVAGRRYTAENILVATGGHPTVPIGGWLNTAVGTFSWSKLTELSLNNVSAIARPSPIATGVRFRRSVTSPTA